MRRAIELVLLIALLAFGCQPEKPDPEDVYPPANDAAPSDMADDPDPDTEACGNGLDDDRDGTIDESCACAPGDSQPCFPGDPSEAILGACGWGVQTCAGEVEFGQWGACADVAECPTGCTDAECACTVGRAAARGAGKVFVWGDEHVQFEEYWPDVERFWDNALTWLSTDGAGTVVRTRVHVAGYAVPQLTALVATKGLELVDLGSADIWIGTYWDAPPSAAWVDAGGAALVMAIGVGSMDECLDANPKIEALGFVLNCSEPAPWGPVGSFDPHPIANGLTALHAPFVNGRYVHDAIGFTGDAVARIACDPASMCFPVPETCDGDDDDCNGVADELSGCPCLGPECDCGGAALASVPLLAATHDCTDAYTTYSAADSCGTELHVVGVYEPADGAGVRVHVARAAPSIVVVSSYSASGWSITAEPGSVIEKVIVNGYEPQVVSAPPGVPVEYHVGDDMFTACAYEWPVSFGGCDTPALVAGARSASGLPLTSFHGCYGMSDLRID